jgi:glycerate kinase
MNKKLLIAPNSFKQAADSDKVAELFYNHLSKDTSLSLDILPISDGGDGFLNVCKPAFNLQSIKYNITTPYDDSTFECEVGYDKEGGKLYIESARVLGMRIIPEDKRNPLLLSSKGLGDLFLHILQDIKLDRISVQEVIIGIGGTGTNDLGLGVCSRFGLILYDIFGSKDKVSPEYFYRIKDLDWDKPQLPFKVITVIDVENPLLGSKGATRIFAPQKGADKGEIGVLELGFNKIINLLKNKGLRYSPDELSGAGGGLAAGLHIFFNASYLKAEKFIMEQLKLSEKMKDADIIITGEGTFDEQSMHGKGAGVVLKLAEEFNKTVILCCGKAEQGAKESLGNNVILIELVSLFNSESDSLNNFDKGIELVSKRIMSLL